MAVTAAKSKTVITDVEVIEEIPLEKVIENTLVKNNVTDQVITSLKEKYGELRLRDVRDKEMYLEIVAARKDIRKVGIVAEKICKLGREDAIKIQKLWIGTEKSVLEKIDAVDNPLAEEVKKYEDEVERIENEKLQRQEEAFMKRQQELLQMGAVYANGGFNLNDVFFESNVIKESDDDIYTNSILPKYRFQYEKINAAKVEEERLKAEQESKLKMEREAFEKEQAEFKKQQEEFQKQKDESERLRVQAESEENKRKAEEQRLKQEAENKLWRSRLERIDEVGWNGQYAFSRVGDDNVAVFTYTELVTLSEVDFVERLNAHNTEVKAIKEKLETERLAKIEQEKQAAMELAAKQERERIEEENKQSELKRQQEEAKRLEELAKASDKDKWQSFITELSKVQFPEFKSAIYKGKGSYAKQLIEEIKAS